MKKKIWYSVGGLHRPHPLSHRLWHTGYPPVQTGRISFVTGSRERRIGNQDPDTLRPRDDPRTANPQTPTPDRHPDKEDSQMDMD